MKKLGISHDMILMVGMLLRNTRERYIQMVDYMKENPDLPEEKYFQKALELNKEIPEDPEDMIWPDED